MPLPVLRIIDAWNFVIRRGACSWSMTKWEYQTSLVLVILGSVGSGVILALLASLGGRWKISRTTRSLEATVTSQGERIRDLEHQLRQAHETFRPPNSDS